MKLFRVSDIVSCQSRDEKIVFLLHVLFSTGHNCQEQALMSCVPIVADELCMCWVYAGVLLRTGTSLMHYTYLIVSFSGRSFLTLTAQTKGLLTSARCLYHGASLLCFKICDAPQFCLMFFSAPFLAGIADIMLNRWTELGWGGRTVCCRGCIHSQT